ARPRQEWKAGEGLGAEPFPRVPKLILEPLDAMVKRLEASVEGVGEPAPDHAGENTRAGTPWTRVRGSPGRTTPAPAATTAPAPTSTPFTTVALMPSTAPSPI